MYRKYSCLKKNKYILEKYNLEVIQDKDIETIRRWRNNKLEVLRQNSKISKKAKKIGRILNAKIFFPKKWSKC